VVKYLSKAQAFKSIHVCWICILLNAWVIWLKFSGIRLEFNLNVKRRESKRYLYEFHSLFD
jgi:hypothetical protein